MDKVIVIHQLIEYYDFLKRSGDFVFYCVKYIASLLLTTCIVKCESYIIIL